MDEVTKIVNEADIMFGLRPALEKFGFPKDKEMFIVFKHEGKRYRTGAIPPSDYDRPSTLSHEDINAAVIDWVNKANIQFSLGEAVAKELDLSEQGDFVVEIKLICKSLEIALTWPRYCVPCYPGASFNCWKP